MTSKMLTVVLSAKEAVAWQSSMAFRMKTIEEAEAQARNGKKPGLELRGPAGYVYYTERWSGEVKEAAGNPA